MVDTAKMMRSNNKRKLIADIVLISSVLLISAFCFLLVSINKEEGSYALVTVGNEEYGKYPLNSETIIKIDIDKSGNGNYNIIAIADGKVDVTEASCPDGICEDHIPISSVGETIVCLPNKMVVTIIGDNNEVDTAG